MNRITFFCFLFFLIIVASFNLSSQEKKNSLESMTRDEILQMTTDQLLALPFEDLLTLANKLGVSIDELLKMQTSVASRTALTPRETPGIVSIVTEEEIRNSGARDVTDVLKLVPGFDFEYDLDGVVGLGFRGSWVHEGKALILLDGQMMNDLAYYNTPFGNHFDVSQIKKIEIVRGPGSAIYGGNAELCVINIITKNGDDLKGISATGTYGQLPETYGRKNLSIMAGTKKGNLDIALKAFVGEANRSSGKYANPDTVKQPYIQDFALNGSKIETQNINLSVKNDNLLFQFIYDNYQSQALMDSSLSFNKFKNISSSLKYNLKLSEKFTINPFVSYQYSQPFNDSVLASRNYVVQRFKLGVGLNYNISENLNLIGGGEFYKDYGNITGDTTKTLQLNNAAVYVQLLWKFMNFNVIIGGRGEYNNVYGSALAPRFGITRVFEKLHFKLLASEAFRSPSVGNIDVSNNLKVEKTLVLETEIGYKINNNMFITGNIYDISITDPIIYYNYGSTPLLEWGYANAAKQGSDGFELEYKYKYTWGFSTINYSFYTDKWKSIPENYEVIGHPNAVLGLPQNKFTLLSCFKLNNYINITPSIVYTGLRYGFPLGNTVIKQASSSLILNFNISMNNLLTKGLNLDLGVYNILNEQSSLIEPYNGGYPFYPGREREFMVRLTYNFKFNK